ncbi:hypothetical protein JX265_013924 [Neoarthrinium moseri]|uniref:Malate dehydrogenase n=1 Tax=Neoarthrinium moseri TaxID=1658444 RepID=A0A9P9W7S6_9PEZI|nr:uncharacterized protein JN550_002908 [Neoarthrinium moseri]KAI1842081.1 hypothetical protein JX266_011732 [Neoarthrinium moseri]KAI1847681.1 hypothetical protein JX265_013924 [Neoarthrinium moseri]KAI1874329.1 hypothetical protein JN550_002908 [Neoarthrinium moseri]
MLPRSVLVFLSTLAVASAGPLRKRCSSVQPSATAPPPVATSPAEEAASPTLPLTGAATELPAANGTLKAIVVGHGIQNYTCSAAGANATSGGAVAVLYDITSLYTTLTEEQRAKLPVDLLHNTELPLNLAPTSNNKYAADVANPYKPDADVQLDGLSAPLKVLGRHYFDASGTPTFDVYGAGVLFKGAKLHNVKAPSTADAGIMNTGAVDWLQLNDKGFSVGLTETYRVVTAGGNPLACTEAQQSFSVPYASQYWFYD